MDWGVTWGIVAAGVAVGVFAGWRGARWPDPRRGPRLVPWRLIMLLAAAVVLLALTHMVNLLGVETGRR
jgi:hypothetical protein